MYVLHAIFYHKKEISKILILDRSKRIDQALFVFLDDALDTFTWFFLLVWTEEASSFDVIR